MLEVKNVNLSKRLKCIADFVDKGAVVADVGTDHGHIPIYLILNEIADYAIAMDINEGPLGKADENIRQYGVEEHIKLKLSDGLEKLEENEADTVIIAGMGGRLIVDILERGRNVLKSVSNLILSPHTEIENVRHYLMDNGYEIINEKMVFDEGKYYTVIKAIHGTMCYDKEEYFLYGKLLLENKDEVLRDYLLKQRIKYNLILKKLNGDSEMISARKKVLNHELKVLESALKYWKGSGG